MVDFDHKLFLKLGLGLFRIDKDLNMSRPTHDISSTYVVRF